MLRAVGVVAAAVLWQVVAPPAQAAGTRLVEWHAGDAASARQGAWQIEQWGPVREASLASDAADERRGAALRGRLSSVDRHPPPAQMVYPVALRPGRVYRVSIDLSAPRAVEVEVMLRGKPAPYEAFGVRTVALGDAWQTVGLDVAWPAPGVAGDVRVVARGAQTEVLVRSLTVDDLGPLPLGSVPSRPFPSTLIGMHVNKLGEHRTWPVFEPGLIRLWDTGTNWHNLGPSPAEFDSFRGIGWERLDFYLDYVRANSRSTAVLYVFGQPPRWASDSPDAKCAYGQGTCGGPKSIEQWRHHVRTLAQRYKGRIRYWELWNEPNYALFYQSSRSLVELARVAREELKAVDAGNLLVSPGFTREGTRELEDFLRDGGGRHVDVIGYHWYYDGQPESLAPRIFNVRRIMQANGVGHLPIWNTEGSALCQERRNGRCLLDGLSDEEQNVLVSRAVLTMWLNGVEGYAYYFLEGMGGQTISMLSDDYRSPSRSGRQFAMFGNWMVGAQAVAVTTFGDRGHIVTLKRGDRLTRVVWAEVADVPLKLPDDWDAKASQSLGDAARPLPADRTLKVGRVPLLISAAGAGRTSVDPGFA